MSLPVLGWMLAAKNEIMIFMKDSATRGARAYTVRAIPYI